MNGASASIKDTALPTTGPPTTAFLPAPLLAPPLTTPDGGRCNRAGSRHAGGYEATAPPRPPRRGGQGGEATETQRGAETAGLVRVEGAACTPCLLDGAALSKSALRRREGEGRRGSGRGCGERAACAPQAVPAPGPMGCAPSPGRRVAPPTPQRGRARCTPRADEANVSAAGGHRPTVEGGRAVAPTPLRALTQARSRGPLERQHPLRCRATWAWQTRWMRRLRSLRRRSLAGGTSPVPPPIPLRSHLARGARPHRPRTTSVARWRHRPHGRGAECRRHRINQPLPSQPLCLDSCWTLYTDMPSKSLTGAPPIHGGARFSPWPPRCSRDGRHVGHARYRGCLGARSCALARRGSLRTRGVLAQPSRPA